MEKDLPPMYSWEDIKVFLKDYFSIDFKEIKKTLKKPSFYSNLLFVILIIYSIIKIIISTTNNIKPTTSIRESIIVTILIFIALILQMFSAYKSGAHRHKETFGENKLEEIKYNEIWS